MPRSHHNPTARTLRASIARPSTDRWTWDAYSPLSLHPSEVENERLFESYIESVPGSVEARRLLRELAEVRA